MTLDLTKPVDASLGLASEMRANFSALARAIGGRNLVRDSAFQIWAAGDAASPTHYSLSGTGATIARTGTGLADTNNKIGSFAAKVTYGSATAFFSQRIVGSSGITYLRSRYLAVGAWVKSSTAGATRIYLSDDITGFMATTAHTGGGGWEWLTAVGVVNASAAAYVDAGVYATSGSFYVSGLTVLLGDSAPQDWVPSDSVVGTIYMAQAGTLAVSTQIGTFVPYRPLLVKHVQLYSKTAPTGAALIVDVNTWDGAAYTSMFSTRPQIAISGTHGGAAPDGTYARRCLSSYSGTTGTPTMAGVVLTADIDQVGSTVAGADLGIMIRALQFMNPLELFAGNADL